MNGSLVIAGLVIKELFRRKDFYVLFVLTALLSLLLGSVHFFNEERIAGYLKEISLLLIWLSTLVIAIATAARQIPAERESRTIFPLLAKPVTRAGVIWGKFLGCWLASVLALAVFYLFFAIITATREQQFPGALSFQAWWMHAILLGVVVAMSMLGSVVFTASSVTVTVLLVVVPGILLVGQHLFKVALRLPEPRQSLLMAIYYLIPHLEFYDLRVLVVHNLDPVPWWAIGGASAYGAAYAGVFLMLTWFIFRKQRL